MTHDLYIFGSSTRGEVLPSSDIDVLVVPLDGGHQKYPAGWSVYSPTVLKSYFESGRLFAWHLCLEAKCIYSAGQMPFISSLGLPSPYLSAGKDIDDLGGLLCEALREIRAGTNNLIFELGIAYTAIRDIAMAASYVQLERPCFSREAPYLIPTPCPLPKEVYVGAMLARHRSTRGSNLDIDPEKVAEGLLAAPLIPWMHEVRRVV